MVQLLSGTLLDDLATAYLLAVENFERVAHPIFSEIGAPTPPPDSSAAMDTSSLGATTGPFMLLFFNTSTFTAI